MDLAEAREAPADEVRAGRAAARAVAPAAVVALAVEEPVAQAVDHPQDRSPRQKSASFAPGSTKAPNRQVRLSPTERCLACPAAFFFGNVIFKAAR